MTIQTSPIDPTKLVLRGPELLIQESYLSNESCDKLIAFTDQLTSHSAQVGTLSEDHHLSTFLEQGFSAKRANLRDDPKMKKEGNTICHDIFTRIVPEHYGAEMDFFELPHILKYEAGGLYDPHADSETWNPDTCTWSRGIDRDFSSIIYLNSEFTGGELEFPKLNLRLFPSKGMLVTFPSDNRFVHAACSTLTGVRYAFVTWGAQVGTPRVSKFEPDEISYLQQK